MAWTCFFSRDKYKVALSIRALVVYALMEGIGRKAYLVADSGGFRVVGAYLGFVQLDPIRCCYVVKEVIVVAFEAWFALTVDS